MAWQQAARTPRFGYRPVSWSGSKGAAGGFRKDQKADPYGKGFSAFPLHHLSGYYQAIPFASM